MNRTQTSAIVLLLASAAAAYEQDAHANPDEARPVACPGAAVDAGEPRQGKLLRAVFAWAMGREPIGTSFLKPEREGSRGTLDPPST